MLEEVFKVLLGNAVLVCELVGVEVLGLDPAVDGPAGRGCWTSREQATDRAGVSLAEPQPVTVLRYYRLTVVTRSGNICWS